MSDPTQRPKPIIIPFARKPGSEMTPNIRSSQEVGALSSYDECLLVTFASLRRFNKERSMTFITNELPTSLVRDQLERYGVHTMIVPFSREVPTAFGNGFQASLYYLDVISMLDDEDCLILDPDVLCIGNIDGIFQKYPTRVGVLPIPYDVNFPLNGLSRGQAGQIHVELGESAAVPDHYGGEAYYLPGAIMSELARRLDIAWNLSMNRYADKLPCFVTEEHFLSYGLRSFEQKSLAPYVKRIWTTRRQRNVEGDEGQYPLWHLPAEKGRGFHRLAADSMCEDGWFWTSSAEEFQQKAGALMGLHQRPFGRYFSESVIGGVQSLVDNCRGIVRHP